MAMKPVPGMASAHFHTQLPCKSAHSHMLSPLCAPLTNYSTPVLQLETLQKVILMSFCACRQQLPAHSPEEALYKPARQESCIGGRKLRGSQTARGDTSHALSESRKRMSQARTSAQVRCAAPCHRESAL